MRSPANLRRMATLDGARGQVGADSQPGRGFGSSALLASLALAGSYAALGLNSISISRIEGADGAGLIALSTQFIFLATFVAGAGLRTSVTYRVGGGLWSGRSAVRGVLLASRRRGRSGHGRVGAAPGQRHERLQPGDGARPDVCPALRPRLVDRPRHPAGV